MLMNNIIFSRQLESLSFAGRPSPNHKAAGIASVVVGGSEWTATGVNHWGPKGACNESLHTPGTSSTEAVVEDESKPPTEWDLNQSDASEALETTQIVDSSEQSAIVLNNSWKSEISPEKTTSSPMKEEEEDEPEVSPEEKQ
jgi:hypothetical protein